MNWHTQSDFKMWAWLKTSSSSPSSSRLLWLDQQPIDICLSFNWNVICSNKPSDDILLAAAIVVVVVATVVVAPTHFYQNGIAAELQQAVPVELADWDMDEWSTAVVVIVVVVVVVAVRLGNTTTASLDATTQYRTLTSPRSFQHPWTSDTIQLKFASWLAGSNSLVSWSQPRELLCCWRHNIKERYCHCYCACDTQCRRVKKPHPKRRAASHNGKRECCCCCLVRSLAWKLINSSLHLSMVGLPSQKPLALFSWLHFAAMN